MNEQISFFGTMPTQKKEKKKDAIAKLFSDIDIKIVESKKQYEFEDIKLNEYVRLQDDIFRVIHINETVFTGVSIINKSELKFVLNDIFDKNTDLLKLLKIDDVIMMKYHLITRRYKILKIFYKKNTSDIEKLYVCDLGDGSLEIKTIDEFVNINKLSKLE